MEESLHRYILLYFASIGSLVLALVVLIKSKATKTALKKYVNYCGHKHLDIEFTAEELQIIKELEL
jgi:hypothetical protein